ncbi:uncharacterized protein A4U43_C01F150 [Asparagus officinalis]|uniref:Ubiquitin-like domain-containing protein n=1 Tax=Asparagus officinalis TaxID=4686 RepID=A0A5P1FL77_ASPOF|nr:uncharacterized protein A4U43_C01F150 [Asparagus officinalis]
MEFVGVGKKRRTINQSGFPQYSAVGVLGFLRLGLKPRGLTPKGLHTLKTLHMPTSKQLAGDKTVNEYNIEGGSVLHLVLLLSGVARNHSSGSHPPLLRELRRALRRVPKSRVLAKGGTGLLGSMLSVVAMTSLANFL